MCIPTDAVVHCGFVSVLERRDQPRGRRIGLHVAILHRASATQNPADAPVVLLSGGPGEGATDLAESLWPILPEAIGGRDLVAVDQRGTRHSVPALDCDAAHEDVASCRRRLVRSGVRLSAYTTEENAARPILDGDQRNYLNQPNNTQQTE